MKRITAVIFDLDGTLLNTLEDLAGSTNYALGQFGFPLRSVDEVRSFVGDGVRKLIERALPSADNEQSVDAVLDSFKQHYVKHCQVKTCLYPGIKELLSVLNSKGYKLAIVSNKLQSGVDELYKQYFVDNIQVAIGERAGLSRKPAPDMVLMVLDELGVNKNEALYVGDSEVDVATAKASGISCVSVLWGFRDKEFLEQHGAEYFINTPMELLTLLEE